MIQTTLPCLYVALTCSCATMGLASAAQAKPAIGLADQTLDTLKDPRFQKSS